MDFTTLSEEQQTALSKAFFSDESQHYFSPLDRLLIFQTLDGTKPATRVETYYQEPDHTFPDKLHLETALDNLNILYIRQRKLENDPSAETGQSSALQITFSRELAENTLKQLAENDLSAEKQGELFGFPPKAVTSFVEDDSTTSRNTHKYAYNELNIPIDDLKYIALHPYAVPTKEKFIRQKIKKGKSLEKRLKTLAQEYEAFSQFEELIEDALETREEFVTYFINKDD